MVESNSANLWSPKGFLQRMLGRRGGLRPSDPLIVPRAEHTISRKNMDEEVIKVLYRLHNSGQKAYLVGGAVRDLLLGRKPKDYDVATDARPDQIKRLFRNSRLIGRRFRLAHIVFKGGKVVEVSTFRRSPDPPDAVDEGTGEKDLLIREDNTWGTPQQDAFRRDFTINGLFYNIADFSVIDYVGGLNDLKDGVIRTIGDPNIRFREDPVRMLRALEYAARLQFHLHPEVEKAIRKHRKDMRKASVARVSEEMINLMRSGAAEPAFRLLCDTELLEILHPQLCGSLEGDLADRFYRDLAVLDGWVRKRRTPRDVTMFAVLFSPLIRRQVASREREEGGRIPRGAYLEQVEKVLSQAGTFYQVPNRREHQLQQAMLAARKMHRSPQRNRRLQSIVERGYFLDALEILEVEVEALGEHRRLLDEWFKLKEQAEREGRLRDPDTERPRRRSGRGGRGRREEGSRDRSGTPERGDRGQSPEAPTDHTAPKRETRTRPEETSAGERRPSSRRRGGRSRSRHRRPSGERSESRQQERAPAESSQPVAEPTRPPEPKPEPTRPPEPKPERTRSPEPKPERTRSPEPKPERTRPPEPKPEPTRPPEPKPEPQEVRAAAEVPQALETPPRTPHVSPAIPEDQGEWEHGRSKRDQRSWEGIAGQGNPAVRQMKEQMDRGEVPVPREKEVPFVNPGRSVTETIQDWAAHVGKTDEMAADTSTDERGKWGRRKRPAERRL